jgi:hypothetical protein
MNTKNNVSNERTKNKTAAFAIVTVALALAMMTAAITIGTQGPQQVNAQSNSGGHSQGCSQGVNAPSSSGGVGIVCTQEAGQCQVAQNSGRDSAGEISGDGQDCS